MSDFDDYDDFANESFENDKKAKPAASTASRAPANPKAKQETPKQSNQNIDNSFESHHQDNRGSRAGRDSLQSDKQINNSNRNISKDHYQSNQQAENGHVIPSAHSIPGSQAGGGGAAGNRQQLIEKNLKLKQELKVLAGELDNILLREKQKREQRYTHQSEDSELKDRKSRVQKQVAEINKLKQNITRVKNSLENIYGNNNVIKKEDELQYLKKQILEVKTEYDGLLNVNEKQQQALSEFKSSGHSSANMAKLRENLLKAKDEYRKLNEIVTEQEKEMRKQHELLVNKEDSIRQLNERIIEKKKQQQSLNGTGLQYQLNDDELTERDITELEDKIKEQEGRRKQIERQYQERQKQLEREKKDLLNDQARKAMILKGKEKEFKLNQIKLREVEKYIKNLRQKDDAKSVVSESHLDQMERENSKNVRNLKRPPIFHKKPPGGGAAADKAIRVEEEREVESEDDTAKTAGAGVSRGRPRQRSVHSPNAKEKDEPIQQKKGQVKSKGVGRAAQPEEEVDLDELNYGGEFEDYESRHSSKQETRDNKTPVKGNNKKSHQEIDEEISKPTKVEQKKQWPDGDGEDGAGQSHQYQKQPSAEEPKGEEASVFSKPSFMLKKKK